MTISVTSFDHACVFWVQLKEMFPGFRLSLPPKRWFKDNYDTDFLDDRQHGLQAFLQNLVAHKDIAHWWVGVGVTCVCWGGLKKNYKIAIMRTAHMRV